MIILAYYPSYKLSNHDAGVAIIKDGALLYAYEEQKLSRVNHRESKYFPDRTMLSALYTTQIDPASIDMIAICGPKEISDKLEVIPRFEKFFGVSTKNVVACPHHMAHTALSVLGSGFPSCVYWTIDAGGEDNVYGEFGTYENNQFKAIHTLYQPSLPIFYYLLNGCCGFSDFEEGKVMGLASYGEVNKELYAQMKQLFAREESGQYIFKGKMIFKHPKINLNKFSHDEFRGYKIVQYMMRELSPELDVMTRKFLPEVIAATGQKLVEDLSLESLKHMLKRNSLEGKPLVLGGGFFQNIIVNKAIREQIFSDVYIPPGVGDMGLAAGAALWASSQYDKVNFLKNAQSKKALTPYLGPSFKDAEVEKLLVNFPVEYEQLPGGNLPKAVAQYIAEGKVVGWFQGRAEFGNRALGARSVLADPRDKDSKARVNQLLKKRDWFMPYAPSILEEYASKCIADGVFNPYMTMAFDASNDYKEQIPSAIHVDGTVRPHIVRRDWFPLYYDLIEEFRKLTGVPLVLNTSFNRHGVPIVATPRQAIEHLMEGVVDLLCINNYVIHRQTRRKLSNQILVPENILRAFLGIKQGISFLESGDPATAQTLFNQTGYVLTHAFDKQKKNITINGKQFELNRDDLDLIAEGFAKEGILPDSASVESIAK